MRLSVGLLGTHVQEDVSAIVIEELPVLSGVPPVRLNPDGSETVKLPRIPRHAYFLASTLNSSVLDSWPRELITFTVIDPGLANNAVGIIAVIHSGFPKVVSNF